jgi:hypothetical protein
MGMKSAEDSKKKDRMIRLGGMLNKCRGKRSLRDIAKQCDISHTQLYNYEQGCAVPPPEVYSKLLEVLPTNDDDAAYLAYNYMAASKMLPMEMYKLLLGKRELFFALYRFSRIERFRMDAWEIARIIDVKVESTRIQDSRASHKG